MALVAAVTAVVALAAFAAADSTLTISALYPSTNLDSSETLYLRGDFGGLSWASGVAMTSTAPDHWQLTVTVPDAAVGTTLSFKVLVQDTDWQVSRGEERRCRPTEVPRRGLVAILARWCPPPWFAVGSERAGLPGWILGIVRVRLFSLVWTAAGVLRHDPKRVLASSRCRFLCVPVSPA